MFGIKEICLCIVYNHNYEANIEKLESLYKGRFKNIFHLMPFYRGDKKNVIDIWENSYQFSGFMAQGLNRYYDKKYAHYVFVGDDVMLDPEINEKNIAKRLHLDENSGFIARDIYTVAQRHLCTRWWIFPSFLNYLNSSNGAQFKHHLPTPVEAAKLYEQKHGLKTHFFPLEKIRFLERHLRKRQHFFKYHMKTGEKDMASLLAGFKMPEEPSGELMFPFVAGFSDFFTIPAAKIKDFAFFGGIFAAARIFAEMAVPTSMALTLDRIVQPKDINEAVVNYTSTDEYREKIVTDNEGSVKKLCSNWPNSTLLIHPIKLSQWRIDV